MAAVITGLCGITGVTIAGGFGMLTDKGGGSPPVAVVITDCPQKQQDAIDTARRNPGRKLIFSGPVQEQCHLNEAVQTVPAPSDGSSSGGW
ncbi:hypothetical protein TPB0596_10310 [Tsukamurella pulmonis]|nr:hypothetical protein AXK56_11785 [Tsukamurella pulmonis]BDD81268.1 hypothetical protein TPB0596_10310 [Tsukamurella pulmonis]